MSIRLKTLMSAAFLFVAAYGPGLAIAIRFPS